jgi:TRAP-type C4-dicarboxylate transport system permease small subunit
VNQASSKKKGPEYWLAAILNSIAALALFGLMIITCIDVFGRYLFNSPLLGTTELTEMGLGIIIFASFPIISWHNEHIVVDMLDRFTPPLVHCVRTVLLNLVMATAFYFLGQRIMTLGNRSLSYGEETEYLSIPLGWVINFIGIMFWLTSITLLTFGLYRTITRYRDHKAAHSGTLFR